MRRDFRLSVCLAALCAAPASLPAAAASFHDHSSLELSLREHGEPETCADLESYSGHRCGYEIERQDDRVRSALLTGGRRVELAPVGLRDVSRFP